jgi:5-methylcytosine-specific restriction endonuclease McrA
MEWAGRCDCGNDVTISSVHILRQKSCGCLKNGHSNYKRQNPYDGLYKKNILDRHNDFYGPPISQALYEKLAQMNCYLCGKPPQNTNDHVPDIYYQGIDRRMNHHSYQAYNCEPCCTPCNSMKSDRSLSEHEENVLRSAAHILAKRARGE